MGENSHQQQGAGPNVQPEVNPKEESNDSTAQDDFPKNSFSRFGSPYKPPSEINLQELYTQAFYALGVREVLDEIEKMTQEITQSGQVKFEDILDRWIPRSNDEVSTPKPEQPALVGNRVGQGRGQVMLRPWIYSIKPVLLPLQENHTRFIERAIYVRSEDGTPQLRQFYQPYAFAEMVSAQCVFYNGQQFFDEAVINDGTFCHHLVPNFESSQQPIVVKLTAYQREVWKITYIDGTVELTKKDTIYVQTGVLFIGPQYPLKMFYACTEVTPLPT